MILSRRTLALSALMVAASWLASAQTADQAPAQSPQTPESSSPPAQVASPVPTDSAQLEVVKAPQPDYPLEAAAKGLQGKVWIQLQVSETGDVQGTKVIDGDPLLATAAENAMKLWKFKPFIKNGKPVGISTRVPFDFALKGNTNDACAVVEAVQAMNLAHHPPGSDWSFVPQRVMEGSIIHRVEPAYPEVAKMRHLQGTVILTATVGKDGRIHNLKALCGPQTLIPTCIEAVQQWRYRPYMLEGEPVDVETTIKVQCHM